MKILLTLVAVLGLFATATDSTTPNMVVVPTSATVVTGSNPYCNKTAADFPMPVLECPPGLWYIDYACAMACYDQYAARMIEIYDAACVIHNADDAYRDSSEKEVDEALQVCLNAFPTPDQVAQCIDAANAAYFDIFAVREARREALAAAVEENAAEAMSDFLSCARECCRKDQ